MHHGSEYGHMTHAVSSEWLIDDALSRIDALNT